MSESYGTNQLGTEAERDQSDEGEQRGTTAQPPAQHGEPGRQAQEREREEREDEEGQKQAR